jgi:hypothetical protein
VFVPVVRLYAGATRDTRQTFTLLPRLCVGMPIRSVWVDELSIDRADNMSNQEEVSRTRELARDEEKRQDRCSAAPRSRCSSLSERSHRSPDQIDDSVQSVGAVETNSKPFLDESGGSGRSLLAGSLQCIDR